MDEVLDSEEIAGDGLGDDCCTGMSSIFEEDREVQS